MANPEVLKILKKGVDSWNKWRNENRGEYIHLSGAELRMIDLSKGDFSLVVFDDADLRDTVFTEADLQSAKFVRADLSGVNFKGANLDRVDFREANLRGSNVEGCNFSGVMVGATTFGNLDLSEVKGLEQVRHDGPSNISTSSIARSRGRIPERFLRGCGLSNWEIESAKLYNPELSNEEVNKILYSLYDLRADKALQIFPLFISYSHADGPFVDKLEGHLNKNGVRFWRDVHDATAGRLEKQIGRAIRLNPIVLLILSKSSIQSDWVEHEVRTARALEKELGRDVLCPITLDDHWKNSPWPERIMEQVMEYNILDFSEWKDDAKFKWMFNTLIDGLALFYK